MERLYRFGAPGPPRRFRSRSDEIRYLTSLPVDRPLRWRQRLARAAALPLDRDERTERRLLPDLRKLNRYERRAFKAKQDALRKLAGLIEVLNRLGAADRRCCGPARVNINQ